MVFIWYQFSLKSISEQTIIVALRKNENLNTNNRVFLYYPIANLLHFSWLMNLPGLELNWTPAPTIWSYFSNNFQNLHFFQWLIQAEPLVSRQVGISPDLINGKIPFYIHRKWINCALRKNSHVSTKIFSSLTQTSVFIFQKFWMLH